MWFYFCEISSKGKPLETEWRLVVFWGWGLGTGSDNDKWTRKYFETMEMFCSWTDVVVAQLSTVTKNSWAGHLKQVSAMLCKLYLSKDISALFLFIWLRWVLVEGSSVFVGMWDL